MSRKSKSKARQWLLRFALLFGVVMSISLKLYIHFQVDLLNKDIHTLEVQRNQLLSEREKMRAEVKRLQNIDRITQIAQQKLSLVNDPEAVQVIRLDQFNKLDYYKKEFAARRSKHNQTYSLAGIK